ncbi:MAG: hypothetical protein NTY76_01280 [Candidatus Omnitrophica bacterium]|nr:hypothetical protein [Candidatus Omnitrophota bacterium]
MREVVYRNLTSITSRKKDIFLQEVFEKDGVTAKTERRCLYFVKDIIHLDASADLQKWVAKQGESGMINKRQFYIFKQHSDSPGEDKFICKILGNFYAIVGNSIYVIAFLQSFKIRFSKNILTG